MEETNPQAKNEKPHLKTAETKIIHPTIPHLHPKTTISLPQFPRSKFYDLLTQLHKRNKLQRISKISLRMYLLKTTITEEKYVHIICTLSTSQFQRSSQKTSRVLIRNQLSTN